MNFFYIPLFTFLLSFFLTPVVICLSKKYKILDYFDDRKIHKMPISRLGGIGLFLSIVLGFLLLYFWEIPHQSWTKGAPVLLFLSFAFFIGLLDDLIELSASKKLCMQTILSLFVVFYFLKTSTISLNLNVWLLILLGVVVLGWFIAIMNAVNIIDGMDGLATGIAIIVFFTLTYIAWAHQLDFISRVAFVSTASFCGFLCYNFYPSTVFMGDSGSMTIGFLLAMCSLVVFYSTRFEHPFYLIYLLSYPILDLVVSIGRRAMIYYAKEKSRTLKGLLVSALIADDDHIHHRFLKHGYSQKTTVLYIYLFTIISCLLSVLSMKISFFSNGCILGIYIVLVFMIVQKMYEVPTTKDNRLNK